MNLAQEKIHQAALKGAFECYKKLLSESIFHENGDMLSKEQSTRIRASYMEWVEAISLFKIENPTQLFILVGCS